MSQPRFLAKKFDMASEKQALYERSICCQTNRPIAKLSTNIPFKEGITQVIQLCSIDSIMSQSWLKICHKRKKVCFYGNIQQQIGL